MRESSVPPMVVPLPETVASENGHLRLPRAVLEELSRCAAEGFTGTLHLNYSEGRIGSIKVERYLRVGDRSA